MVMKAVIVIGSEDSSSREILEEILKSRYELVCVSNGVSAVEIAKSLPADIVLLDADYVSKEVNAVAALKEAGKNIGVIVISMPGDLRRAVEAELTFGVCSHIVKPFDAEHLIMIIERCLERLIIKKELSSLKEELKRLYGFSDIVSKSPRMRKVFELVAKVSCSSSGVLIYGESGTGKELIARAIHTLSERRERPFVAVNCASVPAELVESELFGHEKGAFTGAHSLKMGRFEYASGGTVFLDEVGTLPLHAQAKLLRALQEKSFERVGSNSSVKVDMRVIAATNLNLDEAVREGRFRQDLYFRLKVVPIELPPLRERKEDIPLLVEDFIEGHSEKLKRNIKGITREALDVLIRYPWPGNVRELENLVERLIVLSKNNTELKAEDLPSEIAGWNPAALFSADEIEDYKKACMAFERNYILKVLEKTGWNRLEAAGLMNVHRNTLFHKMKELDIKRLLSKDA